MLTALTQLYTGQLADQAPAFAGILPDGNRVQALEGMEVALVHGALFVEHYIADKLAIITADAIRAIRHMAVLEKRESSVRPSAANSTRVLNLSPEQDSRRKSRLLSRLLRSRQF